MSILIADSGSTKREWCLLQGDKKKIIETQGASPYFLNEAQLADMMERELLPSMKNEQPSAIFFYGTGCTAASNKAQVKRALKMVFPKAKAEVENDLTGAGRGVCGREKGIVAILGTGSNSGYYNGRHIVKNSPGLGYVLGDEGSGAYLGRKVLQYYLYKTFDEDLAARFDHEYHTDADEILDNVYKKPLPNRYIAAFAMFLAKNRGHYMIENIIEDGLQDFFFNHLCKYPETWKLPVHFVGSVAHGFQDILNELCSTYKWELGKILRKPMDGLIAYHKSS
ncbi:MAG TPA: N-acetylglucosamine kinase [Puia sp.]|nr:N-acetylglucosamine kinase [Puia sp.]